MNRLHANIDSQIGDVDLRARSFDTLLTAKKNVPSHSI